MSTRLLADRVDRVERIVGRAARATARRLDLLAGPNGLDPYLRHLDRSWSLHEPRGRIIAVSHPTADVVTVTVEPHGDWSGHRAGQHVVVAVEVDGVRHHRCFSPTTSARRPNRFDLSLRVRPTGTVGRHLQEQAGPGDVIGLSPAGGTFALPDGDDRPQDLLLVSGGSGFTPILSMVRTLADDRHAGTVTWLHYDRTPDSMAHADALPELRRLLPGLRTWLACTRSPGDGDLDGHLEPDHLAAVDPAWASRPIWACGPASLLGALRRARADADATAPLHTESFTLDAPALAPADQADPTGGVITLRRSGQHLGDDGRTLLVQAEAAGLTPTHGCRRGICRTCTTPLLAGTVRDLTTGTTTTVAAGDPSGSGVRLCVSAPVGDVDLDL